MIQYDKELSERLGLPLDTSSAVFPDSNNNNNNNTTSNSNNPSKPNYEEKYSLRPRGLRRRGHHAEDLDESQPKPSKSSRKPTLLSKYRRKTANARERNRMREINQAFETLRRVIPDMSRAHPENEKITKITTLRLAMKYISTLSATLSNAEGGMQDLFSDCSEMDCFLLESDGDSLTLPSDLSDHSVTPGDFSLDFSENSLDFASPLSPELSDQLFDPFLMDFS